MDAPPHFSPDRWAPFDWMGPLLDRVETPVLLADRRGDVVRANAALARLRSRVGAGRALEGHIVALLSKLQNGMGDNGGPAPAAIEKEVVVGGLRVRLLAPPLAVPAQSADTLPRGDIGSGCSAAWAWLAAAVWRSGCSSPDRPAVLQGGA